MRVLHVSEALGGGITSSLLAMVAATPEIDHHLLARERDGHDTGDDLARAFGSVHVLPSGPLAALRAISQVRRELYPDIVHAHSSWAGTLARLSSADLAKIVYSPHCFAFERRDITRLQRWTFRTVERALASRTDLLAAVAPSELDLARGLGHSATAYIPNRADVADVPRPRHQAPLRVVAVGRICPQKDWHYLVHLKGYAERELGVRATWQWLGGGTPADEDVLRAHGIEVSGWIDRSELVDLLGGAQVYVHTAAWEAAPISVLEAAGLGLPMLVRGIRALDSLAAPGLFTSVEEAGRRLLELGDPATWSAAQDESLRFARRHSVLAQAEHLRAAYTRVVPATPLPTVQPGPALLPTRPAELPLPEPALLTPRRSDALDLPASLKAAR